MFSRIREIGFWYWLGRSVVKTLLIIYNRMKAFGVENIPDSGGALVACNHISHLDPPVLGCAFLRKVHFVAKQELFEQVFLRWYLPLVGVIPIKRGSGGNLMLDTAEHVIESGGIVALFPEGTRSKTGFPGKPRTGIIVLAVRTGAPVIPARISGTFDCMPPGSLFPRPGGVQIVFGKPMVFTADKVDLDNREQVQQAAKELFDTILALPGWYPKRAIRRIDQENHEGKVDSD
jgi:1-acyl-sn-glycerol-3-phosphate acyltransferase